MLYNLSRNVSCLIICTVTLVCSGLMDVSLCLAKPEGSSLLEESKQLYGASSQKRESDKWIKEKTGEFLPLDLQFIDENDRSLYLRDVIDRPTILLPIYFYCPNICSKSLANLAVALPSLSFKAGQDYRVIALSFNDAETATDAERAKNNYLKIVGDEFPEKEWLFLTGSKENIKKVTDALGYRFQKIEAEGTFIHPAALMVIAPDGKISRYVYGNFLAGDIDIGIRDAKEGKVSLSVKRLLSFCFNYDPDKNKSVFQYVKIGVITFFTLIIGAVFFYFKRKKGT